MRLSRIVLGLGLLAVAGLTVFGVAVWQATRVEQVDALGARAALAAARETLGRGPALLRRDDRGRLQRTPGVRAGPADPPPRHLVVLAYQASTGRLARAEVPFWFLALKEPALRLALADTGFDLAALGLTADDLRAFGRGLLLDEAGVSGDHLLVWLE